MKKIFVFLIFCLLFSFAYAETPDDSLLIQRSSLYYQYLDIKNNTSDFQAGDYKNLSELLEQLVIYDNRIIDSLENSRSQNKELRTLLGDDDGSGTAVGDETHSNFYTWLFGFIAFPIIIVVLLILLITSIKRHKKILSLSEKLSQENQTFIELSKHEQSLLEAQLTEKNDKLGKMMQDKENLENKLREAEANSSKSNDTQDSRILELESEGLQLRSKLAQQEGELSLLQNEFQQKELTYKSESTRLTEQYAHYKKQADELQTELLRNKENQVRAESALGDKEKRIAQLLKENEELDRRINTADAEIEEFRKRSSHDNDYYKKLSEIDLNMIKLEKLERLKKQNLVPEEEYIKLKKKYLGT